MSNQNKEPSAAGIDEEVRMPPGWNASDESVDEYNPEDGGGEEVEEAVNTVNVFCDMCGSVVHMNSIFRHKKSKKCRILREGGVEKTVDAMHVPCNLCGSIVSKKSMKAHQTTKKCRILKQTDMPSPAKRRRRQNGH